MKKTLLFLTPAIALMSCHSSSGNQSAANQTDSLKTQQTASVADSDNALTAQEKADGWQLLFDGKDLKGWRGYQNKPANAWEVSDGTIHCKGQEKGLDLTDLTTDREYKNFVLSLKWKIAPGANSGIIYRVNEKYDGSYLSGPEYQLIDDNGWPGKLEKFQHTGCNYAMQAPDMDSIPTKPVGRWNTTKIVVNGAHVEHWLNGVKLLQYELWSPEWKKQKAQGKWKNDKAYGMSKTGHIALQDHTGQIWFKDIKLKEL